MRGQVREQPNPMGSSGVGGVLQSLSYLEANELGFHIPGPVSHWLRATLVRRRMRGGLQGGSIS